MVCPPPADVWVSGWFELRAQNHRWKTNVQNNHSRSRAAFGVFDVEHAAALAAVENEATFHNFGFFVRKL